VRRALAALLLALPALSATAQWQFGTPVEVAPARPGVFHHLDASGRQALAVSGDQVALVWEDNRSGQPGCWLGIKPRGGDRFRESGFGRGECFGPGIAALDGGRFALIWEDADGVAAALAGPEGVGPARRLAPEGGQGALAWHPGLGLVAAWSQPEGRRQRIHRVPLAVEGGGLRRLAAAEPADPAPPADDQLHPALAAHAAGVTLAWEDRRLGHTVIYASTSRDGSSWSPAARLSRNPTGRAQNDLGRGTGAMRPALAAFGARLAAVWLDKRDFLSGYDVYAALSDDGGMTFGPDLKAQDSFGDAIAQWHAAVAGNARGELAIAWDDERDGTADVWLTWRLPDGGYADNRAPAAGPGSQTDPVVALDAAGDLHLAWIERDAAGASRLRYAVGRRKVE